MKIENKIICNRGRPKLKKIKKSELVNRSRQTLQQTVNWSVHELRKCAKIGSN